MLSVNIKNLIFSDYYGGSLTLGRMKKCHFEPSSILLQSVYYKYELILNIYLIILFCLFYYKYYKKELSA